MVTQELIAFIREKLKKGEDKESLTKTLLSKKWKIEDINQAFKTATAIVNPLPKIKKKKNLKKILPKIFLFLLILLSAGLVLSYVFIGKDIVLFYSLNQDQLYIPAGYKIVQVDKLNDLKIKMFITRLENPQTNNQIMILRRKGGGEDLNCAIEERVINGTKYCLADFSREEGVIQKRAIQWSINNLSMDVLTTDENLSFEELLKVAEPFSTQSNSLENSRGQELLTKAGYFFRSAKDFAFFAINSAKNYQGF